MKDALDELADEYKKQLGSEGWTVTIRRGPEKSKSGVEFHHITLDHVISGELGYTFEAGTQTKEKIRATLDRLLQPELKLIREAPPMRNPARIAFIRTHFSGYGWDEKTRTQAATLLALIRTITRAEAEWLVRAGVPIGGRGTPNRG